MIWLLPHLCKPSNWVSVNPQRDASLSKNISSAPLKKKQDLAGNSCIDDKCGFNRRFGWNWSIGAISSSKDSRAAREGHYFQRHLWGWWRDKIFSLVINRSKNIISISIGNTAKQRAIVKYCFNEPTFNILITYVSISLKFWVTELWFFYVSLCEIFG